MSVLFAKKFLHLTWDGGSRKIDHVSDLIPGRFCAGAKFRSAMCNGLDLRPATALHPTCTSATSAIDDLKLIHDMGATREVDLGSLSAQLFSPICPPPGHKAPRLAQEWGYSVSEESSARGKMWQRPSSAYGRSYQSPQHGAGPNGVLNVAQTDKESVVLLSSGNVATVVFGRVTEMGDSRPDPLKDKGSTSPSARNAHSARPAARATPHVDSSVWTQQVRRRLSAEVWLICMHKCTN